MPHADNTLPVVRISAPRTWVNFGLGEVWRHRELLYFLTWRDVKVRYKQTVIGIAWAVVQPLATLLLFTIVFGRLAKMPSDGIPYPLFSLAGLVPWNFFSNAMTTASNGLATNANLITKVYFRVWRSRWRRSGGVFDFLNRDGAALRLNDLYHAAPSLHLLWLPVFIALAFAAALAVGLWLSRAQCGISRRALYPAVPRAVLDVRHTGRLPEQPAA